MSSGLRKLGLLFTLLMMGVPVSFAQTAIPDVEYPTKPCELRDEHRVFVQAPLSTREEIVKKLRGRDDLVIAERPEEADYFLFFAYTPFAEGVAGGATGAAARAEMTVVKFVNRGKNLVRPRILYYWGEEKSSRNVPMPFNGFSPSGFTRPHSNKSAVEQLIGRFALWALTKKWPNTFYFDQFTNQLTISRGGKLETSAAKAFLKKLKEARSDSYARECVQAQTPLLPADMHPQTGSLTQISPTHGGTRPRSFKRGKKGHRRR
jgi:hypothetical protein